MTTRAARSRFVGAAMATVLAFAGVAGCDRDDPTPSPSANTPAYRSTLAPSPKSLKVQPVPDCPAVLALIPADVSTEAGMFPDDELPLPSEPPSDDVYTTDCHLLAISAVDRRIKVGIQVRIMRPRTDPYSMVPVADWLRRTADQLVGYDCQGNGTVTDWSGVDNGRRCAEVNTLSGTALASAGGTAKGAIVRASARVLSFEGARPDLAVVRGAAEAAAGRIAESILKAV